MSSGSKTFFADLQGFTGSGKFYLKELGILECDKFESNEFKCVNDKVHHHIFKPPFEWKKLSVSAQTQALWLKCFHHGFSWNHGDTEYSEIESVINGILTNKTDTVYVKGAQKVFWFNYFTKGKFNCVNIEDIGCVYNLKSLERVTELTTKHCHKHDASLHCALQNIDILHYWLQVLH